VAPAGERFYPLAISPSPFRNARIASLNWSPSCASIDDDDGFRHRLHWPSIFTSFRLSGLWVFLDQLAVPSPSTIIRACGKWHRLLPILRRGWTPPLRHTRLAALISFSSTTGKPPYSSHLQHIAVLATALCCLGSPIRIRRAFQIPRHAAYLLQLTDRQ